MSRTRLGRCQGVTQLTAAHPLWGWGLGCELSSLWHQTKEQGVGVDERWGQAGVRGRRTREEGR